MKRYGLLILVVFLCKASSGQDKNSILKELSEKVCNCIDSVTTSNKTKVEVSGEINRCIDGAVIPYQLAIKLSEAGSGKAIGSGQQQNVQISINQQKQSEEYKSHYYEIERYLMDSCKAIKIKIGSLDLESEYSYSKNKEALDLYYKGVDEVVGENYKKAQELFEQALNIDSIFAFAWDNLGICYRKMGEYDKALNAYSRSLKINPRGLTPLQNIPVVYQYLKEYDKAIEAYQALAQVDENNAEVYYGTGLVYTLYLEQYEDGLKNLCKAYTIYVKEKSPYRADCEKAISIVFREMKKQNKEDVFYNILKENNISTQ